MTTMEDIARRLSVSKGTVSKALSGATDISETLRKSILETAVEMGYARIQRSDGRRLCVLVTNMAYQYPGDFGYDLIMGFRKLAEPGGFRVDVVELTDDLQQQYSYDAFMLKNDYVGAFVLGLHLQDSWTAVFEICRTPALHEQGWFHEKDSADPDAPSSECRSAGDSDKAHGTRLH